MSTHRQEFFKQAGKIRGALWLWALLGANASPVADRDGWRICFDDKIAADSALAEVLGATAEQIVGWRRRLTDLGYVRFDDLGEGCSRIWVHKRYAKELDTSAAPDRVH